MKIRIIERNDGLYQYEFGYVLDVGTPQAFYKWDRCEHMRFKTEEEARKHAFDMVKFMSSGGTKRIVEEIDL